MAFFKAYVFEKGEGGAEKESIHSGDGEGERKLEITQESSE